MKFGSTAIITELWPKKVFGYKFQEGAVIYLIQYPYPIHLYYYKK